HEVALPTGDDECSRWIPPGRGMWQSETATNNSSDARGEYMSGGKYPISLFLAELIQNYGPTESAFLERLGYRNIERGLRRLRLWTEGASGHEKILKQIAATFPEHATSLRSAVEETKRAAEDPDLHPRYWVPWNFSPANPIFKSSLKRRFNGPRW